MVVVLFKRGVIFHGGGWRSYVRYDEDQDQPEINQALLKRVLRYRLASGLHRMRRRCSRRLDDRDHCARLPISRVLTPGDSEWREILETERLAVLSVVEQRYLAVREVLEGAKIIDVAVRYRVECVAVI